MDDTGDDTGDDSGDEEFVLAVDTPFRNRLKLPGLDGYSGDEFYTLIYTTFTIKGFYLEWLLILLVYWFCTSMALMDLNV